MQVALASFVVVLWIVCGVLSYGLSLAYFQRKYNCYGLAKEHRAQDVFRCFTMAFAGPAALASLLICGFTGYGWIWRPIPDSEINHDGIRKPPPR